MCNSGTEGEKKLSYLTGGPVLAGKWKGNLVSSLPRWKLAHTSRLLHLLGKMGKQEQPIWLSSGLTEDQSVPVMAN